jgi:hypothetical protein
MVSAEALAMPAPANLTAVRRCPPDGKIRRWSEVVAKTGTEGR